MSKRDVYFACTYFWGAILYNILMNQAFVVRNYTRLLDSQKVNVEHPPNIAHY